ncbi:anaphase-promoting complex subunit 2 isoform X2 [Oryctolagus cuniculus]|uniref:anaphase-promoting complex subunit 2 isoform X2 n=1 Tax=Oryctolagus cuniculus TaxID=9986 RepID=UPI0038797EAC
MVSARTPRRPNRRAAPVCACALSPTARRSTRHYRAPRLRVTAARRAQPTPSQRAAPSPRHLRTPHRRGGGGVSESEWAKMEAAGVQGDGGPGPGQDLLVAWNTVSTGLVPPAALGLASSRTSGAVPPKEEELRAAVEVLRGHGLHSVLEEWFVEVLQNDLQAHIAPEFWNALSQRENAADEPQCLLLLLDAFGLLESRLDPYLRSLELLEKWTRLGLLLGPGAQGLRERVHTMLRGVLFFSTPRSFQEMVQRLYGRFLRVYMQSKRKGEGGTDPELEGELDSRYARRRYYRLLQSPLCAGCGGDKQRCWCRQALEQFQQLSQVLHRLSLLERVSAEAVTTTLHQVTRERMEDRCRGEYERSFLREFHKWIERVVGWLGKVFLQDGPARPASPEAGNTLRRWRCHVQRFFYRTYASLRIEELFSIVRDFPDSRPAIEDLKYCLERTDQRQQLLVSLKAALEARLLHPGVNTCDIITLYISAIKALRVLDPSMVILEVACEPIRRYLRTREDTVRQIVAGLTGDSDGTGDLAVELSKTDPASLETGQDSEDDSGEPEDWVPDPVDADPGKSSSKRRSSDIISLLVSIYGSKDLFINEYRSLLADRLLHHLSFSPEREIRNVELLKLRFGEAPMHFCEVMLKDMADSRRINANIREEDEKRPAEEQPPFSVYAVILSSEFWPPFKDEKLEVPEDIRAALEVYCKKYEKLKVAAAGLAPSLSPARGSRPHCPLHGAPRPHCPLYTGLASSLSPGACVLTVPCTGPASSLSPLLQGPLGRSKPLPSLRAPAQGPRGALPALGAPCLSYMQTSVPGPEGQGCAVRGALGSSGRGGPGPGQRVDSACSARSTTGLVFSAPEPQGRVQVGGVGWDTGSQFQVLPPASRSGGAKVVGLHVRGLWPSECLGLGGTRQSGAAGGPWGTDARAVGGPAAGLGR